MDTTNTTAAGKTNLTTITYAVGLLLFLLPFFNIKCNNMTMAHLKGIDMAIGGKPSVSGDLEQLQNGFGNKGFTENDLPVKTKGEGRLFVTALAALAFGVIGLILSLVNKGRNQRPNTIAGALAAIALVGSWIEIALYVKSNLKPETGNAAPGDFPGMVNITASPTFWFILSLLCFAASAYVSYKKGVAPAAAAEPPPAAPQLKIDNPGDQSEFPAAPTDDRELG